MILEYLTYLLGIVVAYVIYKHVFVLYWRCYEYVKQGLTLDAVYPIGGFGYHVRFQQPRKYGEPFYDVNHSVERDPNKKFFLSNFGSQPMLFIVNPQVAKEFYALDRKNFSTDAPFPNLLRTVANGLVLLEGQMWKKHRKILSELFHFEHLQSTVPVINEVVNGIYEKAMKVPSQPFDAMEEFQLMTGSVVARVFLGGNLPGNHDERDLTKRLANLANTITIQAACPLVQLFGAGVIRFGLKQAHRDIVNDLEFFRSMAKSVIERDRNNLRKPSARSDNVHFKGIFQLLMEKNALSAEAGSSEVFTDEEIIDEFVTFYAAGMDTTGHLAEQCAYYLINYPEHLRLIEEELRKVFKSEKECANPTMDQLASLKYLTVFIKEVLRHATVASFIFERAITDDFMLGGIKIKKNSLLTVQVGTLGYHPLSYKQPYEFRPERWLNEEEVKKVDPFCDVQFSAGARNCIGQHLARMESKLIILHLIRLFEFTNSDPHYERKLVMDFLIGPETKLMLKLRRRAKSLFD